MVYVSTLQLYYHSQPDFDKLKVKGWTHPVGIRDEVLENSLVKTYGAVQFQIVRDRFGLTHRAKHSSTYTTIYVSHKDDDFNAPLLKGEGTPFPMIDTLGAVLWLAAELEDCQDVH